MAGAHVQIYLWTFDRGWPQESIIQKCMSGIYDVNVEGNSLVMCSWGESGRIPSSHEEIRECMHNQIAKKYLLQPLIQDSKWRLAFTRTSGLTKLL
jgi:hypothetical protein